MSSYKFYYSYESLYIIKTYQLWLDYYC